MKVKKIHKYNKIMLKIYLKNLRIKFKNLNKFSLLMVLLFSYHIDNN
jgi:hypothetical protein